MVETQPETYVAHLPLDELAEAIGSAMLARDGLSPIPRGGLMFLPDDVAAGLMDAAEAAANWLALRLNESGLPAQVVEARQAGRPQ
jgi:hypothetical protein